MLKAIFAGALVLSGAASACDGAGCRLLAQVAVPEATKIPLVLDDTPLAVKEDVGVLLTTEEALNAARRIKACEAERDSLKDSVKTWPVSPAWFLVGGLLVGVGLGFGAAKLIQR